MSGSNHNLLSTPPKISVVKYPFTPSTPKNDNRENSVSPLKITGKTQLLPTRTPNKTQTLSLITPDFTPKLRKRKELFDSLAVTQKKEVKLLPQASSVGSGRVHSLKKKLDDFSDDEAFSNSNSPTKPRTPRTLTNTYTTFVSTPKSKVVLAVTLDDRYIPYDTVSSPTIRKARKNTSIFAKGTIDFTESFEEDIVFNPHEEILLINKDGDKMLKKFDTRDKFDREYKPKKLLDRLSRAQKDQDSISGQDQELKDDAFVKRLLREDSDNSDSDVEDVDIEKLIRKSSLRSNPFLTSSFNKTSSKKFSVFRD